jgi:Flp pilus assembly pilin Flp
MTQARNFLRKLRLDQSGATIIEFAFVAPVFIVMLIGGMDLGYSTYIRTIAAGTLDAAARSGSLESATDSAVQDQITDSISKILPNYARRYCDPRTPLAQGQESCASHPGYLYLETKNYTNYSRIQSAEKIVLDGNNNGSVDAGDCWIDEDANNAYGVNEGLNGRGGADDGVYYTVHIVMKNLFPMNSLLGLPETRAITVKTLVINQPFRAQTSHPTVCLPPPAP